MRAGRLRGRVELQNYSIVKSTTGFETKTWATVVKVWAGIEALRGMESDEAGERVASMNTRIIIRSSSELSSIDESWRVKFGTRIFAIESIIGPDDRSVQSAYYELMCEEGKKDDA